MDLHKNSLSQRAYVLYTSAKFPRRKNLHGMYTILKPFHPNHFQELFHQLQYDSTKDIYMNLPYGPFINFTTFEAWGLKMLKRKDVYLYTIYSKYKQQYLGVIAFIRAKPKKGSIEIGHVVYGPSLQNTVCATEAMYSMLSYAFDSLNYRRCEWECNALNAESAHAAKRFGFTYEGTSRQACIIKNNNWDIAWFSQLDKEWIKHKPLFKKYLTADNFTEKLEQKKRLNLNLNKVQI